MIARLCPARADYERLVRGDLSWDDVDRLSLHLEQCSDCTATLDELGDQDVVLARARDASGSAVAGEMVPEALFQRLSTLGDETLERWGGADANDAVARLVALFEPPRGPHELGSLGPYRIQSVLGVGGMGVVFRAEETELGRLVAVKAMKPDLLVYSAARERFLREARAAAALDHERIVTLLGVGQDRGVPYFAMPLLRGETLEDFLKREATPTLVEAVRIGRETAEGLAVAHAHGLIHRDIKPANLWLESRPGATPAARVKLLDFGLVRVAQADSSLTVDGRPLGTPSYMAPEQARGAAVDARADLFSLGCVLYRMTTGTVPYSGNTLLDIQLAIAGRTLRPARALNPAVPASLSNLLERLLAVAPDQRPASADAVVAELTAIEHALRTPPERPRRRAPRAVAVLALLLAGTALAAGLVVRLKNRDGSVTELRTDAEVEVVRDGKVVANVRARSDAAPARTDVPRPPESWPPGAPLSLYTTVGQPPVLPGLRSWSIETLGHRGAVQAIAYRPDGRRLASAGVDGVVRLWDTESLALVGVVVGPRPVVCGLSWSPDGKALAVSDWGENAQIWDAETGQRLHTLQGGRGFCLVTWSPDGTFIATSSDPGSLDLWDPKTGARVRSLPGSHVPSHAASSWSPDGRKLATLADDGAFLVWNLDAKDRPRTLGGGADKVYAVAFSPDGRMLASAGEGGTVRLRDATGAKVERVLQVRDAVRIDALAWSPDSRYLVFPSDLPPRLHVLDVHNLDPAASAGGAWDLGAGDVVPRSLAWSPDGRTVALGQSSGTIQFWDPKTGKKLGEIPGENGFYYDAHNTAPIANQAALATFAPDPLMPWVNSVWRWDLESPRRSKRISPGMVGGSMAISADGTLLANACRDGKLLLWELPAMALRHTLPTPRIFGCPLAFSPDGRTLAAADDLVVRLWDTKTGIDHRTLHGHAARVERLAWSAKGDRLATAASDGVRVWDVSAGVLLHQLADAGAGPLAWSPGDNMLATAIGAHVSLWDAASGECLDTFRCADIVDFLTWSPDGRSMTISGGMRTQTWDVGRGQSIRVSPLPIVTTSTSDGRTLISAQTSQLFFWHAATHAPQGSLLMLRDGRCVAISADGHYAGSPHIERALVYVVQTNRGQELLTAESFADRFGWKNDPARARVGGR